MLRSTSWLLAALLVASCSTPQSKKEDAVASIKELASNATGIKLHFIKRVKTDAQPKQVCLHPLRDEFYVANLNNGGGAATKKLGPGSLQIFSLSTFKLLHSEPARTAVECFLPDNDHLLYSDMFRDEVVYFDLNTRKVLSRTPIKPDTIKNFSGTEYRFMPKIIEPTSDSTAVVTLWLGGMSKINFKEGKLIKNYERFCALPRGILPIPGQNAFYIMCYGIPQGPGEIVKFDMDQGKVTSRIRTGGSPRHVVLLPDGKALISNLNSGEIYLFDPATGKILHKAYAGGGINTIDTDPSGRFVFISQRELDLVSVIDTKTWETVLKQHVGDYPTGLDVSYDGKLMAVTNFHEASLDLYSIEYIQPTANKEP